MKLWMIVFTVFIAGCSHGQLQFNGGAASTTSGGSAISSSSAGLKVQVSGSTAAALIGLGIIAAGMYDMERYRSQPAELSPTRLISEQDCTKPIDWTRGNLKCR
jgi:hypothetical protein